VALLVIFLFTSKGRASNYEYSHRITPDPTAGTAAPHAPCPTHTAFRVNSHQ